jgi:hypothetical protein
VDQGNIFFRVLVVASLLPFLAFAQSASEYNQLGFEAYQAGRYEDAVGYFESAYARDSKVEAIVKNLTNARMSAAQALALEGKFEAAVLHLERAMAVSPDNFAPLVQAGAYFLRMNRVSDAIFRLEEAIKLKPGVIEAHELLGEAYYQDNDLPSARAQWDYVLELEPDRPGLRARYEKAFREESVEQDFNRGGSRHFAVTYPKEALYASKRGVVLSTLERAYLDIGRQMGRVYPPTPIQVIVYSAEQFTEATQLDAHVGAVYDGKIRAPLTDANGRMLSDEELKRRLVHEYVHVVVRHITQDRTPWWVNEGLAEMLSVPYGAEQERLLKKAYRESVAFALKDLEGRQLQRHTPAVLRLAYAHAHAGVRHLWTRFGQMRFRQFLDELASGTDAEEALYKHFRKRYADLDMEIARGLR